MSNSPWEKKTIPTDITDRCREIFTQAVGDGWHETTGTIIMDKDNRVVGFRMALSKDGALKEIVVPASPELSVQVPEEGDIAMVPKPDNPWAKSPPQEPS